MKLRVNGGGGGDEPKPKKSPTYTSRAEIDKDNAFLREFMKRRNVDPYLVSNSYVARDIGDTKPSVILSGTPPAGGGIPLATELPFGVGLGDVIDTQDGYGFYHPQNGTFVPVNMDAILMKYGQPQKQTKLKVTK